MKIQCVECKTEFETNNPTQAKYCSTKCKQTSQIRLATSLRSKKRQEEFEKNKIGYCLVCGKQFERQYGKSQHQKYCSTQCNKKASADNREVRQFFSGTETNKTCVECGKEFTTTRSFQIYCSAKCNRKASARNTRGQRRKEQFEALDKHRKCVVCNTEFEITQQAMHKLYCSRKCKMKANRIIELDKARFGGNKKYVLERDNYKCVLCSSTNRLAVHHIDLSGKTDNPNNDVNNLISLCASCHLMVHKQLEKSNDVLKFILK